MAPSLLKYFSVILLMLVSFYSNADARVLNQSQQQWVNEAKEGLEKALTHPGMPMDERIRLVEKCARTLKEYGQPSAFPQANNDNAIKKLFDDNYEQCRKEYLDANDLYAYLANQSLKSRSKIINELQIQVTEEQIKFLIPGVTPFSLSKDLVQTNLDWNIVDGVNSGGKNSQSFVLKKLKELEKNSKLMKVLNALKNDHKVSMDSLKKDRDEIPNTLNRLRKAYADEESKRFTFKGYENSVLNNPASSSAQVSSGNQTSRKSDFDKLYNCLCKSSGGSLGGYYAGTNQGGPCMATGPLTSWYAPMPFSKKALLGCRNYVDQKNYEENLKIFDEMRKNDELVYQKLKIVVQKENAKCIEEDIQKINSLIFPQRDGWEDLWIEAGEIYKRIADMMLEKDKQAMQSILTARLINAGQSKVLKNSDFNAGIKAIELSDLVGGPRAVNNAKRLEEYKRWKEPWNKVLQEDIPNIKSQIKEGKLKSAMSTMDSIRQRMTQRQLPVSEDPRWNELSTIYNERSLEMQEKATDTFKEIGALLENRDPKKALSLIDNFPKWEEHTEGITGYRPQVAERVSQAESEARQGDTFNEHSKFSEAISSYKKSLQIQDDSSVQRKLDDLLKRQQRAGDYNKKGWAALDKSDLASALESFEASVKQWPDPNISQLIASLRVRLQEKKKNADAVAAAEQKANREAQKKKDDAAMTAAGLSLTDRFTGRDSGRDQVVGDRNSFDSYNTPEEPSNSFGYEQMTQQVNSGMNKQKEILVSKQYSSHSNDDTHTPTSHTSSTPSGTASTSSDTSSGTTTTTGSQTILNTGNIAGVQNNPKNPTTFTIKSTCKLVSITNYHWNNAKGSKPGTIGVRDSSGKMYGPWSTIGKPGQGGVPNAYWTASPNISLPAGTYTIVDSENSTWANNSGSNYRGMTDVVADCGSSTTTGTTATGTVGSTDTLSGTSITTGTTTTSGSTAFSGTMTGSWKGSGGIIKLASGTFTMTIAKDGKVTVRYEGDDYGSFTGNISNTGKIDLKQAGGSSGTFSWKGTIKKDAKGNLSGSGTWTDDDVKGTWQSKGSVTQTSAASSGMALPARFKGTATVTTVESGTEKFPITINVEDHYVGPESLQKFKYNATVTYGFRHYCGQRRIHLDAYNSSDYAYVYPDKNTFTIPGLGIWNGKISGNTLKGSYPKTKTCSTLDDTITISIELQRQ